MNASLIKELRDISGAGMMDCKKALEENNNDIEKATEWLREKGIAKAAKKAGRIAAEGLSTIKEDGNKAVILEINCETDFVAKNEKFQKFMDDVATTILNSNAKTNEEALALPYEDGTLEDYVTNMTATIGEKISFRRFTLVEKSDDEHFGAYIHMGGKISVLTVLKGADEAVAKDVSKLSLKVNLLKLLKKWLWVKLINSIKKFVLKNKNLLRVKIKKALVNSYQAKAEKSLMLLDMKLVKV